MEFFVDRCKGNTYLVDIGSHEPATLSYLAFENASKKTRTEMKLGDLIYGQLLVANKDMEPELVCIDFYNQSAGMGVLPEGGLVFTVSLNVARSLVQPENPFLMELAHVISFEMLIGFNGRIWLKVGYSITIQIMPCAYGAFLSIKLLRQPKAKRKTFLKNLDLYLCIFIYNAFKINETISSVKLS